MLSSNSLPLGLIIQPLVTFPSSSTQLESSYSSWISLLLASRSSSETSLCEKGALSGSPKQLLQNSRRVDSRPVLQLAASLSCKRLFSECRAAEKKKCVRPEINCCMITIICDRWSSRIKLGAVKQQQQQQSWMAGLVWRLNPRMSWSSAGEAPSTQMTRVCVCHAGNKLQAGRSATERRVSLSAVRPTAPLPPSFSLSHQT